MIPEKNLKMIADVLSANNLKVYTKDITENPPRPCFQIRQVDNQMQLLNRGTELQMRSQYEITYFADKRYLSAIQMQIKLMELLSEKIQSADYVLYPSEISYQLYPDEGVLVANFSTYNYHSIGAGTPEGSAQLMQQMEYETNY